MEKAAGYDGQRVDFIAKDLDIRQFLRAIGEIARKHIVVADEVSGTITIRLRDMPWDKALDKALRRKGLYRIDTGDGTILVIPATGAHRERDHAIKQYVRVRLIPVNFRSADELVGDVKALLSRVGSVTTDERTNVFVVSDLPEILDRVERLVRSLDVPIPLVLLEAVAVDVPASFLRSVGLQINGQVMVESATGKSSCARLGAGERFACAPGPATEQYKADGDRCADWMFSGSVHSLYADRPVLEEGSSKVFPSRYHPDPIVMQTTGLPGMGWIQLQAGIEVTPQVTSDGLRLKLTLTCRGTAARATTTVFLRGGETVVIGGGLEQCDAGPVPGIDREMLLFVTPRVFNREDLPGRASL
jgi:hypothetical protein